MTLAFCCDVREVESEYQCFWLLVVQWYVGYLELGTLMAFLHQLSVV